MRLTYEDALYYLWKEQRLPVNADIHAADLDEGEERVRLARVFQQGLGSPVGCMLPLKYQTTGQSVGWISGQWPVRSDHLFLIPGDSPMGLRLPLDSIPASNTAAFDQVPVTPFEVTTPLPEYDELTQQLALHSAQHPVGAAVQHQVLQRVGAAKALADPTATSASVSQPTADSNGSATDSPSDWKPGGEIVRTAMCIEPRDGNLHVFMPPTETLEAYLELLTAVEQTAEELELPVVVEGYLPPHDYRLKQIKVTPDPGVIEVNVQPASNWSELVEITRGLYEDARLSRLGTEKFDVDGSHTGTGGGNHIVMGAQTPLESPFLRRPDLLRSLISYWHNHPSLSYLFSGKFIGPTSQAPRVDEGRRDATYELQIAFEQIPETGDVQPWLVDRIFRHLLVDLTGNTHRAEFCIDKLFSPDTSTGRLGLIEFRAFEMPPHWQMSLTQQLLLRSLVARFWQRPYREKLVDWDTSIHDRWMLPHFLHADFEDVIEETDRSGIQLETAWFEPHFEFRFPVIGQMDHSGVHVELRNAIEPWYVLGEEPAHGATARYVDSSIERMQIKVEGIFDERYVMTCNGRRIPLHPTGTEGEWVAGIRYRGWQPPSCLHPTIPVDEPLVFDLLDTWLERSLGGCRYHVGHPGGLNPEAFPVNALEAESRRAARFFNFGHTTGTMTEPPLEENAAFPMTLDLRRNRSEV